MPQIIRELDFELVRQIVFRQGELRESGTRSLPVHFNFDGYNVENVSHNIKKLHAAHLITVTTPQNWVKGQLSIWPTGLTENGWRFLETSQNEEKWTEAIETVEQQGGAETLGPLKATLFAGARKDA